MSQQCWPQTGLRLGLGGDGGGDGDVKDEDHPDDDDGKDDSGVVDEISQSGTRE